jgi:hypothetical protein
MRPYATSVCGLKATFEMAPPGSEAVFVTSISCADSAGASDSVDCANSLPRREAKVLASLGDVSAGGRGVGSVELAASVWALEALAGVPPVYEGIRQHTSAYVSIRQHTYVYICTY